MNKDKSELALKSLNLYNISHYSFNDNANKDILLATGYWHEFPGLLDYNTIWSDILSNDGKNSLFIYTDFAGICYYLLSRDTAYMFIGPISFRRTDSMPDPALVQTFLNDTEKLNMFQNYIKSVPVLGNRTQFDRLIRLLAEEIFETSYENTISHIFNAYSLYSDIHAYSWSSGMGRKFEDADNYVNHENQLFYAVSLGDEKKAFEHLSELLRGYFRIHYSDSLRDIKNEVISINVLLRKAIESSMVNTYTAESTSSEIIEEIERAASEEEITQLLYNAVAVYASMVREHVSKQYSANISKVTTYIHAHFSEDLSLSVLAGTFSLNPSHLSSRFRKEVGSTVTEYINAIRMEYARQLLLGTTLNIVEIAESCGISDANYFSRIFKKNYKVTPNEYRKTHSRKE